MGEAPKPAKVGSIIWSILISIGIIALAGSIFMPSTKRARLDFVHDRDPTPAATEPTTEPASQPAATQP